MATEARRVVTVERGTEWEEGFARPRVMLQPGVGRAGRQEGPIAG